MTGAGQRRRRRRDSPPIATTAHRQGPGGRIREAGGGSIAQEGRERCARSRSSGRGRARLSRPSWPSPSSSPGASRQGRRRAAPARRRASSGSGPASAPRRPSRRSRRPRQGARSPPSASGPASAPRWPLRPRARPTPSSASGPASAPRRRLPRPAAPRRSPRARSGSARRVVRDPRRRHGGVREPDPVPPLEVVRGPRRFDGPGPRPGTLHAVGRSPTRGTRSGGGHGPPPLRRAAPMRRLPGGATGPRPTPGGADRRTRRSARARRWPRARGSRSRPPPPP